MVICYATLAYCAPTPRLQSSEGRAAMSRELEPVPGSAGPEGVHPRKRVTV